MGGTGLTDEYRRREQLLDVKAENIKDAAQNYLIDRVQNNEVAIAVLGKWKEWVKPGDGWDTFPLSLEPEKEEKIKL